MGTLSTLRTTLKNIVRTKTGCRRPGLLTTLLFAGVLFGALQGSAKCDTLVMLGMPGDYVNVTAYIQTDQYGNLWVVGFDDEDPFEIVLDDNNGTVLDPTGKQIGVLQKSGG